MNLLLAFAGLLTILLGVIHSFAGELDVLPRLENLRDEAGRSLVSDWTRRVVRGAWHTLSLFGLGLGLVLFVLAFPTLGAILQVKQAIAISTFVVGGYWAIITRLWHPAWVVFGLVSALCWWS